MPFHWSPTLPLVTLLNSVMVSSQPSSGIYLLLTKSQNHQGAPNTSFLPSLQSLPALAHLLPLLHLVPAYSWQRTRHTPASGPLHLLYVCQESLPLDIYITYVLRSLLKSQLLSGPFLAILV